MANRDPRTGRRIANHHGDPCSHSEPTSRSGKERGKDAEKPKCEESGFETV